MRRAIGNGGMERGSGQGSAPPHTSDSYVWLVASPRSRQTFSLSCLELPWASGDVPRGLEPDGPDESQVGLPPWGLATRYDVDEARARVLHQTPVHPSIVLFHPDMPCPVYIHMCKRIYQTRCSSLLPSWVCTDMPSIGQGVQPRCYLHAQARHSGLCIQLAWHLRPNSWWDAMGMGAVVD